MKKIRHLIVASSLSGAFPLLSVAATATWSGNSSVNWSDAANWGGIAPVSGDNLIFNAAGTQGASLSNDIASLQIGTLTFGASASAYTFGGSAFTLTGGIAHTGTALQTIGNAVALSGAVTASTSGGGNLALNGVLSGSGGSLTVSGTGTTTLGAANTYTAGTAVSSGTLAFSNIGTNNVTALGTGSVTLGDANTGTANVALLWTPTVGGQMVANAIVVAASGTGTVTIGTATNAFQNQTFSGALTLNRATTLTGGTSGRTNFNGVISGNVGTLTIAATNNGSVVFGGGAANTYTGGTVVSSGTLAFSNVGALGSGSVTLGDADTGAANIALLWTPTAASQTVANAIVVAAAGTGTVTIGTAVNTFTNPSYSGALTLNRATTLYGGSSDRTNFKGGISGNVGTLTIANSRVIFEGTAVNTFTGDVVVAGGATLQLGVNSEAVDYIPDASSVTVNGTLNLSYTAGGTETINALNGSGTIGTLGGAGMRRLQVGAGNGSGTFSGVIGGSTGLALTKTGTGTQTLSGANTYAGGTVI